MQLDATTAAARALSAPSPPPLAVVKILLWTPQGLAVLANPCASSAHGLRLIGARQKPGEISPLVTLKRFIKEQFTLDSSEVEIFGRCWKFANSRNPTAPLYIFVGGYRGVSLTPRDASSTVAHITVREFHTRGRWFLRRWLTSDVLTKLPYILSLAATHRAQLLSPSSPSCILRIVVQLPDDSLVVVSKPGNLHTLPCTRRRPNEPLLDGAKRALASFLKIVPDRLGELQLIQRFTRPGCAHQSVALFSQRLSGSALPTGVDGWETWRLRTKAFGAVANKFVAGWEAATVLPVLETFIKTQQNGMPREKGRGGSRKRQRARAGH